MSELWQEPRRLYSRGPNCLGLAIDEVGVMFGPCRELVRKTPSGYHALGADQLSKLFRDFPEIRADSSLSGRLSNVAKALQNGDLLHAQLLGLQLPFAAATALSKADYNDAENRNAAGEWATSSTVAGMVSSVLRSAGLGEATATALETTAGISLVGGAVGLLAGMVYPSGNWRTYQGTLPDHPDIDFRYDEGELSLYGTGADGKPTPIYRGRADQDGFYRDPEGHVIGRDLGSGFQMGPAAISALPSDNANARSLARTTEATDEPEVCPAPSRDHPHGASLRADFYQWQITGLVPGLAVALNGHVYDGCDLETGHMLEAKGPGLEALIRFGLLNQWVKAAQTDVAYAGGRIVEWHFAEEGAADKARQAFADAGIRSIEVIYTPPNTIISPIRKVRQHDRYYLG